MLSFSTVHKKYMCMYMCVYIYVCMYFNGVNYSETIVTSLLRSLEYDPMHEIDSFSVNRNVYQTVILLY